MAEASVRKEVQENREHPGFAGPVRAGHYLGRYARGAAHAGHKQVGKAESGLSKPVCMYLLLHVD